MKSDGCLFYFGKIQIPFACNYFVPTISMSYRNKLATAVQNNRSTLCVGLDPDLDRIPESIQQQSPDKAEQVVLFLKTIIDLSREHCAAYKPNLGFFEALGPKGLDVFGQVRTYIPEDKIVVADVKRGDISSTAAHYAKAYFEQFDTDAVTINPLMGFESLGPFLDYPEKGIYTLTLTSNPGAADFLMKPFEGYDTMASYIAENLARLQKKHAVHLGMVVGATKASSMSEVIAHHPEGALLIPGIGAQGGSVDELLASLRNHKGIPLVNSSRSILYAGEGQADWQEAVKKQAQTLKQQLSPITDRYVS